MSALPPDRFLSHSDKFTLTSYWFTSPWRRTTWEWKRWMSTSGDEVATHLVFHSLAYDWGCSKRSSDDGEPERVRRRSPQRHLHGALPGVNLEALIVRGGLVFSQQFTAQPRVPYYAAPILPSAGLPPTPSSSPCCSASSSSS